ncbi:MAG: capsular biosynthesis protein [Magnetococcales bacterium]|nr:capsular biosynthesis protein [Magnetococcales bacterium]
MELNPATIVKRKFDSTMAIDAPSRHQGYIDLHCHILPGIDDGAENLEMALEMAQMAVDHGTSAIMATPHIIPGVFNNTLSAIRKRAEAFRIELKKAQINLTIYSAAEIRLSPEVVTLARKGELPFFNQPDHPREDGKNFVLLELPHQSVPVGSDNLVSWLVSRDIVPIIAHPERNTAIQANQDLLRPFMKIGCLVNLTAGSFLGGFGPTAKKTASDLLQRGWGHILASDAHNLENRTPILDTAVDAVSHIVGPQQALSMVTTIPEFLI